MPDVVTLERFNASLGMPGDGGANGPELTAILDEAERRLADLCGRPAASPWVSASRTEYLDGDIANGVLLTYTPITAVSAVVVTTGASSGTETTSTVSTDRLAVDGYPIGGTFTAYTGLLHFRTTGRDRLLGFEYGEPIDYYGLDPGPAFPAGHNRIKVTYTGGIVTTGNMAFAGALRRAVLELATGLWRNSGADKSSAPKPDMDKVEQRARALAGPFNRWRF